MPLNLVVLTDFSPAGARACAYAAALAAPLGAALHLVHVFSPVPMTLHLEEEVRPIATRQIQEADRLLRLTVQALPMPATAEVVEADWEGVVAQAIGQYQPVLLLAGLTATDGPLAEWLSNGPLPLAHLTGYPLLLVPEYLPLAQLLPPTQLVLAVEDQPFRLTPQGQALAPVLAKLHCAVVPVTVLPPGRAHKGGAGLRAVQHSGLANNLLYCELHRVVDNWPAAGIWQATDELEADMVALLDQGHGWVHKLFSGSVIANVLRYSQIPVLLLPLAAD